VEWDWISFVWNQATCYATKLLCLFFSLIPNHFKYGKIFGKNLFKHTNSPLLLTYIVTVSSINQHLRVIWTPPLARLRSSGIWNAFPTQTNRYSIHHKLIISVKEKLHQFRNVKLITGVLKSMLLEGTLKTVPMNI